MFVVAAVTSLLLFSSRLLDQIGKINKLFLFTVQLSFQVSNSGVNHAIGLFLVKVFVRFLLDICLLWISGLVNHKIILYMWEFGLCRVFLTIVLYYHVYWLAIIGTQNCILFIIMWIISSQKLSNHLLLLTWLLMN